MPPRMRCLPGSIPKSPPSRRLLTPTLRRVQFFTPDMLETVHEIAIYIHRFHNLDLFQQGYSAAFYFSVELCGMRWYQIKISARWEDGSLESCGTPSRVIQYEGTDFR
ncbi:hypothetical protein B296_00019082 [Ensete ventricosum]|uniref:Uncharacterized protein n=1 Tax=Ensete ventricosum TaxID=4639 RepID=A0A426YDP4_ENSVE|nr:hypothetical protein B296_00019082 [Ensete ventricosum]